MKADLVEFRSTINRMLARGELELPVVNTDGKHLVVFASADDPLFALLAQLRNVGGYANVFVKDGDRIRRMTVMDSASAIPVPDDDLTDVPLGPRASVGMFLDYLATQPNGVVLPVVNPASPGIAKELASV